LKIKRKNSFFTQLYHDCKVQIKKISKTCRSNHYSTYR